MTHHLFALVTGLCSLVIAAAAAPDRPIPLAPWSLELLASAPDIRHPSVVCAAPDGRIFVAEDPMDIAAPAHASQGRIITFHPDGRRTIFATNLFAVFGLQYLEGRLYVLHNPRFTVFRDAGDTGTHPEDLIESTNPNPWALDWNDHVPANFRLAMDGYFYMAVGDKGIYDATGRDGRKVSLHGGGILRLRPDGTGMEIYSTGVRNILDVALSGEDEMFTYDNTDEHDWMGRLTHMVDGGFYGYPHDFVPRRPYTLWMMHDFGGGAATGTFANTEDALPAEYHDNLFLADFGKRQIIRVIIAREGATFKVVRHEELFSDMPDHFRPVGIAPSHDGKSIYICDWQHRDTKENVEVGRLWKLAYTGKTFEKPKPSWYVPTALGQKCDGANAHLISALAHPSRDVRLTAQRELSRRGPAAAQAVQRELSRAKAPAIWHALWALDDSRDQKTKLPRRLVNSGDPATRRQVLRFLGHGRGESNLPILLKGLRDSEAPVRFQAATSLGRVGTGVQALQALLAALDEGDHFTRYAITHALHRIGLADSEDSRVWPLIVQRLADPDPAVRELIGFVLRDAYAPELVRELSRFIREKKTRLAARAAALASLAHLTRKFPEWKGQWWAYHPALAPAPIRTVAWGETDRALQVFTEILKTEPDLRLAAIQSISSAHESSLAPNLRELYPLDERSEIREAILKALAAMKDSQSGHLIIAGLAADNSPELQRAALSAAKHSSSPEVRAKLIALIPNEKISAALRAQAITTLAQLGAAEAAGEVAKAAQSSNLEIRSAAIEALGKLGGPAAAQTLLSLFDFSDVSIKNKTLQALGQLKDTNAVPKLLSAYTSADTRDAALDALLRIPDVSAVDVYVDALGNLNPATRERARKVLEPFRAQAWPAIRPRVPTMRPAEISELQKLYPHEQDLTLLARKNVVPTTADYLEFGLKNPGDTHRGRRLFHDQTGVACIKCHTVAGTGNAVGPDMTTIGAQFPRIALIEHIIHPSKAVREGYSQVLIETDDDESFAGLVKGETTDTLTILDAQAQLRTIPKSKITLRRNSELSLMPDGLHLGLTLEEFADLLAYLESLKK